jgi:hypothetical protein
MAVYDAQMVMADGAREMAAAVSVLRKWRNGRLVLAGYCFFAALATWPVAWWGHGLADFAGVFVVLAMLGLIVLWRVTVTNELAAQQLTRWRPDLAWPGQSRPAGLGRRGGGRTFCYSLVVVGALGLFFQALSTNTASTAEGTAHVTNCVGPERDGFMNCYGSWEVSGRSYSGALPGRFSEGNEPSTVTIHYDPDNPATLGEQDYKLSLGLLGMIMIYEAYRWVIQYRTPYMIELQALIKD